MTVQLLPGIGYDCNVYLVTGPDPILVDTGTGEYFRRTLSELSKLVKLPEIRRVLLTHRHFDHVGGVPRLLPPLEAEVFIHEKDAAAVSEAGELETSSQLFGIEMQPIRVSRFADGTVFSTGEHDLKVVYTPGHTAGSVCLYSEKDRFLISGDTVFVEGVGRWDLPSGRLGDLVLSIEKLSKLDFEDLYPGHGPIALGNGKARLEAAMSYLGAR
jgi:hydroxyacylglutathione hydrolase